MVIWIAVLALGVSRRVVVIWLGSLGNAAVGCKARIGGRTGGVRNFRIVIPIGAPVRPLGVLVRYLPYIVFILANFVDITT